ncbi:type IV secretory system conjugative DNA transfer family protein [Cupriavidus necator]
MNKCRKLLLATLATAGIIAAMGGGQYLAGVLFAQWQQLPESAVGISTLHNYWLAYGNVKAVKQALAICTFVSALVPITPVVIVCLALFSKPKRELHGSARFARTDEIRRSGLLDTQGKGAPILVGKVGHRYLQYWGQQFVMLAAPTRSGKGVAVAIPNLLTFPDSVVVLDVKLENYGYTSAYRQRYGQSVFLWAPFDTSGRTHRWNPLERIVKSAPHMRLDALQAISSKLYYAVDGRNAFFYESARGMFEGLALFLIETGRLCTFGEILRQGTDPKKSVRQHFQDMMEVKGLSGDCLGALTRAMSGGDEAMANVLATFNQGLQLFSNPMVDAATSACDFDVGQVRRERISIYLGMPANRVGEVGLLANLFFSQLIEENTAVLPAQDPTLQYQCLLMLDEFTALGYVKHIDKANAFMAGYNLRLLTIIQSVAQMQAPALYGEHGTRTLVVNHGLKVVYPPKDHKEANEVSDSLGYLTETAVSKGRSFGKHSSRSVNASDQKRALMLAQELEEMDASEEIVLGAGKPIRCQKAYFYNDPTFVDRLKEVSPSLRALGDGLPTHAQLEAALFSGELSTNDVPAADLASWHAERDLCRADDERRPLTAAERLALDQEALDPEIVASLQSATAEDLFQLTGVRPDVASLMQGLLPEAGPDIPGPSYSPTPAAQRTSP